MHSMCGEPGIGCTAMAGKMSGNTGINVMFYTEQVILEPICDSVPGLTYILGIATLDSKQTIRLLLSNFQVL